MSGDFLTGYRFLLLLLENKVYWADLDTIESVNLDGTDRQVVYIDQDASFYGIELVGEHLYVVDKTAG